MKNGHQDAALKYIHQLFGEGTLAGLPDARLLELYTCHRDELAFKALVQRHGPMVQAVCRGVVGDANDADDAFQATFLLLIRKAGSLWVRDSLGGWLHRVACRIALEAKSDLIRRHEKERRAAVSAVAGSRNVVPWDDARIVLHQEIDRLPERYRQPIVLCYLEGMTYEHAARHLGWSVGMTQGRLTRARHLLRARLTRRGVTLAGAVLGSLTLPKAASAVSITALHQTVQSARYFALGKGAAGEMGSRAATALVKGTLRKMMFAKLKMVAAAALIGSAVTFVATGLAATSPDRAEKPPEKLRRIFDSPNLLSARGGIAALARPGTSGGMSERRKPNRPLPTRLLAVRQEATASAVSKVGKPVDLTGDLLPRGRLNRGDSVFSTLGGFKLHMRQDGNLVLYVIDDLPIPGNLQNVLSHASEAASFYNVILWSSGTDIPGDSAGAGSFCVMHEDGNFVIYDEDSRPCFETGTRGYPGSFLRCQNDGNVVIYTPGLEPVWHSGTYARPGSQIAEPVAPPLSPRRPMRARF